MIRALYEYQFLQNAFLASILASIVCGIIGVIVVEKKLVMMSGGIAHTAYGGVGLGYLFGNILSVTKLDLYLMIVLTFLVVLVVIALFNNWVAYLFDEEFASIIGIKTAFLDYLLLILVAMTVVVLIRVAGIIMGLWISYALDIASGASIVILSVSFYFAIYTIRAIYSKMKRKSAIIK